MSFRVVYGPVDWAKWVSTHKVYRMEFDEQGLRADAKQGVCVVPINAPTMLFWEMLDAQSMDGSIPLQYAEKTDLLLQAATIAEDACEEAMRRYRRRMNETKN